MGLSVVVFCAESRVCARIKKKKKRKNGKERKSWVVAVHVPKEPRVKSWPRGRALASRSRTHKIDDVRSCSDRWIGGDAPFGYVQAMARIRISAIARHRTVTKSDELTKSDQNVCICTT